VIQPLRAEGMTFGKFYETWIDSLEGLRARVTRLRDYRGHWRLYLKPMLEHVDLRALSVGHIAEIRKRMVGKKLSEKTIRNSIDATLRAICRDAKRQGHHVGWPFDQLEWEDYVPEREADPFTEKERERILDFFARKRWRAANDAGATARSHAYLSTLFKTGMRPSEVAGLRVGDVDFAAGTILVRRSRNLGSEAAPKTRAARRIVRLDPELVRLLRGVAPATANAGEYLFRNHSGQPIDQRNFDDSFRAVLRALGIRVRGLYQTKHTYASIALSKNVNPKWVAEQLGITLSTLEHHYGRFMHSRAADRAEIEKMFPRAFNSGPEMEPQTENNPTLTPREREQRIQAGGK
jgi:integrase